jgi:hypothetical protein
MHRETQVKGTEREARGKVDAGLCAIRVWRVVFQDRSSIVFPLRAQTHCAWYWHSLMRKGAAILHCSSWVWCLLHARGILAMWTRDSSNMDGAVLGG